MRRVSPPTTSPSRAEHALACHPAMPCAAVRSLRAAWHWRTQGGTPRLHLRYTLHADVQALRLPGRRPPRFADGLWRHTCFEAFVGAPGGSAYHEFNFAPSGQWAAYDFRGYRTGMAEYEPVSAPRIDVDRGLSVSTFTVFLPECEFAGARFAGLSAVIEEQGGRLSYWAARHGGEKPDFHNPACFMLPVP